MIGAGNIVTTDMAQNKIVAGNPARVLRGLEDFPLGPFYREHEIVCIWNGKKCHCEPKGRACTPKCLPSPKHFV